MRQKTTLLMMLVLTATLGWAQPNGTGSYYQSADGHKGKSLKTALYEIIKSPSVKSYSELFECYKTTDLRPDGKIWDMYSNSTNYDPDNDHSGNYTAEGDMFNREHSFPKNWFGNIAPMNSDLFHVIPTDGYVNNRRSNYPFGETNGNAEIRNNKYTTRSIRYNSSSPRFACYTTGQEPVSLYKRNVSSSIRRQAPRESAIPQKWRSSCGSTERERTTVSFAMPRISYTSCHSPPNASTWPLQHALATANTSS